MPRKKNNDSETRKQFSVYFTEKEKQTFIQMGGFAWLRLEILKWSKKNENR